MRLNGLSMAAAAITAMGDVRTSFHEFGDLLIENTRSRGRRRYQQSHGTYQSAESRKFHLDRAVTKRVRKGAELRRLADLGAIAYSPRQIMRNVMMQNGYSQQDADRAFDQATTTKLTGDELKSIYEVTMSHEDPEWVEPRDSEAMLNLMTVAELIDYGRKIGVKVTTKMTKAKLIDAIRAAG